MQFSVLHCANNSMGSENLKELFRLNKKTSCETHDLLKCKRVECCGEEKREEAQPRMGGKKIDNYDNTVE